MSDALKESIDRYRARLFAVEAERDAASARVAALTAALKKARAYVNAADDNWARLTLKEIDATLDAAGGA